MEEIASSDKNKGVLLAMTIKSGSQRVARVTIKADGIRRSELGSNYIN
jgi:hypothetical protein